MTVREQPSTMTFLEHLEELRSRLIKSMLAALVGVVLAWLFRESLLDWLTRPFVTAWNGAHLKSGVSLHFPAPASLFFAYLKLSVIGGTVAALPVILYQLWSFVAPGLYSREKRFAVPFVATSTLLFATGGYFGWRLAFPLAFRYLLGFSGRVGSSALTVTPTVMIDDYLDFVARMLLAFGAIFELPVLAFFLSLAGVVTHRHLIKFARYFVVVAFVIAAILTPPDVVSQLLLAGPLCLLYAVSVGVAWLVGRRSRAGSGPDNDSASP